MPSPAVVVIMRRHNAPTFRFIAPRILLVAAPRSPLALPPSPPANSTTAKTETAAYAPVRPEHPQQTKQTCRSGIAAVAPLRRRRLCFGCCAVGGRRGRQSEWGTRGGHL